MKNLKTGLDELNILDKRKYQVITIIIKKEDGLVYKLPLPMPYIFTSEDVENLQVQQIEISRPLPLPSDASIAEINNDKKLPEEDCKGK